MKVCIVTTSFPRWPEDIRGTFVYEAARALQGQGVDIRVIAMHSPGAKTREKMGLIEVIRPRYLWPEQLEVLQKEGGGLPIMWRKSLWARLTVMPFFLIHSLTIARYARNCDVIHANWTLSATAALVTQPFHGRPIVVTVQGSDITRATQIPFVSRITRGVLHHCSQIIALSRALTITAGSLGLSLNNIEIIPNGVDTKRFFPSTKEREPLIVFVGALAEIKGIKYLIQCMPQVISQFPDYRLAIVGEGPLLAELRELAAYLGLSSQIVFAGSQTPFQVSEWMRRASLFVLPSLEEGLGVVLLEAMACGTPCIGTNVGGIPDVITPEVGRLVPPANPTALAEAIITVLSDSAYWADLSCKARLRVEQSFNWESIAYRLIRIYRRVLLEHSRNVTGKKI